MSLTLAVHSLLSPKILVSSCLTHIYILLRGGRQRLEQVGVWIPSDGGNARGVGGAKPPVVPGSSWIGSLAPTEIVSAS